ncbi:lantibiotic dehydratase [Archangium violaceum]|uniref:lantibiotic dehydratase n=1 Tax=Archangium violaceum TaxID=83451 RepID=UPI00194F78BA|nr:lantibiotic dehydratase [Archangium violaceum]QRO01332.1 lantibiotic dehydratase [Archangium violaceum]
MSGRWTLGEVFVLRHAGFPFDWLEGLGFSESLRSEVAVLLEDERALVEAVRTAGGEDAARSAREALERGKEPSLKSKYGPESQQALERYRSRRAVLSARYTEERQDLRRRLRERAAEPAIQEAVFFSNPAMYENVWSRYLEGDARPDNSDARRVERQVYTYLQRFCAKNETTSFFGPISYGECDGEDGTDVRVVPSGSTRRRTFLTFWAVTELARAVGRERAVRPRLPLRVNPIFKVEAGRASCAPLKLEVALSPEAERLLGVLPTAPTLDAAARELGVPVETVERWVVPLVKSAVVLLGLPFVANDFATLESLREAVVALPASEARERWLSRLDELERLRAEFEGAGLARRRELLQTLETRFTEYTGKPARRGEGQVYSDRLILYEEASSPFRLKLGRRFSEEMAAKLSGGLELSAAYGDRVQGSYREQVRDALGSEERPLDFLEYAVRLRPDQVAGSRFAPVPPILLDEDLSRARTLPEDFLGTSKPGGRYALPDVCLAATGDGYEVMCARVHHHLMLWSWLSAFYPDRARYESVAGQWLQREPAARGLVGLAIRRRNKGFYVYPGRRLVYSVSDVLDVEQGALKPHDVKVLPTREGPVLVDGEGQELSLYMPLDDFNTYPPFAALAHPQVLHAKLRTQGRHLPRLSIGGAVYQRERWELPTTTFSQVSGVDLLLAVERERRASGWPRFVFMRSSTERKPYLIDTASPFALELLLYLSRAADQLSVEEMYPAPEQLWLKDERGRYTCEMRMQAVRWSEAD